MYNQSLGDQDIKTDENKVKKTNIKKLGGNYKATY